LRGRRARRPARSGGARAPPAPMTVKGRRLHLRLAIDYSARHTIYQAASKFYKVTDLSSEAFASLLSEVLRGGSTDVDLLIRTGGEQRLSDFLLWECAFAEFVFLEKRWPDFTPADLRDAVVEFEQRERTRGALPSEC
jgi:undecaprenyl diphosphate synthase